MASTWSGSIYVIPTDDGKYLVSVILPSGVICESSILMFAATGPFPPTGFPGSIVDDIELWCVQLQQKGFLFVHVPA